MVMLFTAILFLLLGANVFNLLVYMAYHDQYNKLAISTEVPLGLPLNPSIPLSYTRQWAVGSVPGGGGYFRYLWWPTTFSRQETRWGVGIPF